ncbi:MAG: NADH-quinone oxidoreductase subunit NuoB [Deltaproteobacteria bacterium]|nr:NADH-quinone oxidoreductase subunit NuoB [Deltaproteobacteria bacterium]
MWEILKNRWRQGYRTLKFPEEALLPERFRGRPILTDGNPLDLGKCLFSPDDNVVYSRDYRMAVRKREDLILKGEEIKLATALDKKMRKLFGRSLKLRAVCAGSCNGCDLELQALNNVVFDLSRFGIQFVASPRHADGLVVTGPVTENMKLALKKTYEAVPDPKIVIAVGACAISGGPFEGSPEVNNGADKILPVDLYIPGCPPHPLTILDGLLRLLGRIEANSSRLTACKA